MPQPTIAQAMQIAVQHHQAGRLAEAGKIYRQVLARQPDHATALHLLGLVCYINRELDAAEDLIKKAIAIDPRAAECSEGSGQAR
jgi:Flp pilus assembly protein TadD